MFAMQHPKEVPQELAQQLLDLFGKLGYSVKTVQAAELQKLGIDVPEKFLNAQVGIVTGNPVAEAPAVDLTATKQALDEAHKALDQFTQAFRRVAIPA